MPQNVGMWIIRQPVETDNCQFDSLSRLPVMIIQFLWWYFYCIVNSWGDLRPSAWWVVDDLVPNRHQVINKQPCWYNGLWDNDYNLETPALGRALKRKCLQDDCPAHCWRHWRQALMSPVMIKTVILMTFQDDLFISVKVSDLYYIIVTAGLFQKSRYKELCLIWTAWYPISGPLYEFKIYITHK